MHSENPRRRVIAVSKKTRERLVKVKGDIPVQLYRRKIIQSGGKSLKQSVRIFRMPSGLQEGSVMVKDGAKKAGEVHFVEGNASGGKKYFFLYNLRVEEEYKQQLIGRSIVQEIIEVAENKNVSKLMLDADAKNPATLNFYTKLGFKANGIPHVALTKGGKSVYVLPMLLEISTPKTPF